MFDESYYFLARTYGVVLAVLAISLLLSSLVIIGYWKLFQKGGEPGWACLVPFYCHYVLYKLAFGNGWLFLLLYVPFVNIVLSFIWPFKLAKAFGHDIGYGLGLLFLGKIFIVIMGFDNHAYRGPESR